MEFKMETIFIVLFVIIFSTFFALFKHMDIAYKKYETLNIKNKKNKRQINKLNKKVKELTKIMKIYKFLNPNWRNDYKNYLKEKKNILDFEIQEYISHLSEAIKETEDLKNNFLANQESILLHLHCSTATLSNVFNEPKTVFKAIWHNPEVIHKAHQLIDVLQSFRSQFSNELEALRIKEKNSIFKDFEERIDNADRTWKQNHGFFGKN